MFWCTLKPDWTFSYTLLSCRKSHSWLTTVFSRIIGEKGGMVDRNLKLAKCQMAFYNFSQMSFFFKTCKYTLMCKIGGVTYIYNNLVFIIIIWVEPSDCCNTNLPQILNDHTHKKHTYLFHTSSKSYLYKYCSWKKQLWFYLSSQFKFCVPINQSLAYLALQHMHTISVGRGSTSPGPSTLPKQMENYACWLESSNESYGI